MIANEALKTELLPSPDDPGAIFRFAMLFDGYEHFGSLEESSAQARARRRETLTDLRNELFISCRRSRHQDSDEFISVYRELYPLLQRAIHATRHGA